MALQILTEKHNLISETKFQLKSFLLIVKRLFKNVFTTAIKFSDKGQLTSQPIIAISESNLWDTDDNEQNWILTAGKIQNLRLAAKRLNGIEVNANKIFSFWKHIGNPNIGQGYVVGREIREGCILPTIAGGLCQLTNALYDAALKANFQIVERHRHTKIIKGSLAEKDRDATVKWNYIDLRFKSDHSFRIEIDITPDKLIVQFRSNEKNSVAAADNSAVSFQSSKLNDCYSCGNFECYRHPGEVPAKQEKTITTFILDQKWSEYDDYIQTITTNEDFFIVPFLKNKFTRTNNYNWTIKNHNKVKTVSFTALKRALQLRLSSKIQNNIFSQMLRLDKEIAGAMAKRIPVESTHLVVSQNLLPFLWEHGVLGGRTFDVLMTRLPMEKLHERLDMAYKNFPESKTLNDFRASQELIDLENIALTRSRHIITPHKEIADIFNNKSIKLNWAFPKISKENIHGNKILFPASGLGRKGAYEIKRLAKELNLDIVIAGRAEEEKGFWKGINIQFEETNTFKNIAFVVYPAYIEHAPRRLLKALASGIPVITTTASGLDQMENLTIIPVGDYEALKEAFQRLRECKATSSPYSTQPAS